MRTIEWTSRFKRDYKREKKGRHAAIIDEELQMVSDVLRIDEPLPARYNDHALTGNWSDHRDCHLRPDLVLIYRRLEPDVLQMVRLGSHAELF